MRVLALDTATEVSSVALLCGVLLLVGLFRTSSALASAYGIAVTTTMVVDGILGLLVVWKLWHWKLWQAAALVAPLVSSGRLNVLLPPRLLPEAPDFHLVYRKEDASTSRIKSIRRWIKEIVAALEHQAAACDL